MNLQEAILDALPRLRAQAESRMVSRCLIHRRSTATGETVRGRVVDTYTTVGENVPCRLKAGGSRKIDAGDVEREQATPEVHLPASWTDLDDDDLIVLTAGEWAGTVYRVVEAVKGDQQTARRVRVEETDLPRELQP